MQYIYPDNLKAKPTMFLWQLRDVVIISIGAVISIFAIAQTGIFVPLVITAVYAFLTIQSGGVSILDFVRYAVGYFLLRQQEFEWRM